MTATPAARESEIFRQLPFGCGSSITGQHIVLQPVPRDVELKGKTPSNAPPTRAMSGPSRGKRRPTEYLAPPNSVRRALRSEESVIVPRVAWCQVGPCVM
jgi:hypothetical protein